MEKELENYEDEEELVNVDGTKVKLSGKVLKVKIHAITRYVSLNSLRFKKSFLSLQLN